MAPSERIVISGGAEEFIPLHSQAPTLTVKTTDNIVGEYISAGRDCVS